MKILVKESKGINVVETLKGEEHSLSVDFYIEEKIDMDMQRQKGLIRQGVSTEPKLIRVIGETPSDPLQIQVERTNKAPLFRIFMSGIIKSE